MRILLPFEILCPVQMYDCGLLWVSNLWPFLSWVCFHLSVIPQFPLFQHDFIHCLWTVLFIRCSTVSQKSLILMQWFQFLCPISPEWIAHNSVPQNSHSSTSTWLLPPRFHTSSLTPFPSLLAIVDVVHVQGLVVVLTRFHTHLCFAYILVTEYHTQL